MAYKPILIETSSILHWKKKHGLNDLNSYGFNYVLLHNNRTISLTNPYISVNEPTHKSTIYLYIYMCSKTYKSHLKQSPRLCHYLTSAHPINPFMRRSMKSNQVAWPGQSISKPSSRLPKQIKTTTERSVWVLPLTK